MKQRKRRGFFILIITILTTGFLFSATGYSIKSLHSDITISPTGVYEIEEEIVMDFHERLHGFYRVLPVEYLFEDGSREDVRVRVSKIKASDTLSVSYNGNYVTIRVGDANRTVIGVQDYGISYHYDIGSDPNDGYDEFYYNIVGEDWEVPIESFSFSITFPKPVDVGDINFSRGLWGTTSAEGVTWELSSDGLVVNGRSTTLQPGEAVTVRVQMPEGYYDERTDYQFYYRIGLIVASILLVGFAWLTWSRHGRDKDLIIVPNHEPPEGMSPLDVGYIIDESLDPKDVTSMIFYWADMGCLTIVEEGKEFSFIKGHDPKNVSKHEKQIFDAFFSAGSNGVVKSKDLKGDFFRAYQKLKGTVDSHYRGERALASAKSRNRAALTTLSMLLPAIGYSLSLTGNYPGVATIVLAVLGIGESIALLLVWHLMFRIWHIRKIGGKLAWTLVLLLVLGGSWFILVLAGWFVDAPINAILLGSTVLLIANTLISFFAIITRQRSDYGRRVLEQVLGLREFIATAEMEELKRMIDSDPEYYYHILSFAIVLGLERKWAKKFASLAIEPPSWYVGPNTVWNAMVVSSMLNRCNSSLVTAVATAPSSGSPGSRFGGSSFGGGGFSGGGFGGGGGGAW
ncbi:DUF2207 domain-containing protein [Pleomorphochaeta sp. DL1XJH-081]|jgi:uncharacterized membrane protein YgcG|uniref:DUF2207 domain-containing protein n=1 Tax=Pleomorphochaeta sp. DL1XJH-081 TaxID=3409690 RepID=UPI003BB76B3B